MKNLKKLTAVLLTVAMITAMALVPAFAEGTSTISADATICKDLGVLQGENGVTADYLAKTTLRYQAAIMYLRLLGLEDDALAGTYTENFKDASKVNSDNQKILGYLKAHPELGFVGDTVANTFDPLSPTTVQMIDKVMLVALGYKEDTDFTYAKAVSFAAGKGLVKLLDKSTISNDDFATSLVEALKTNVNGQTYTLTRKLINDKIITEKAAVDAGLTTATPPAATTVKSVTPLNLKQLQLVFSAAVDADAAKTIGNYKVYNGGSTTDLAAGGSVALAADGVTATITLGGAFNNGTTGKLVVSNVVAYTNDAIAVADITIPTVIGVAVTGPSTVTVEYSEPVTNIAAAEFTVDDGNYIVGLPAANGSSKIDVPVGVNFTAGEHKIKMNGNNVTDYAGYKVVPVTKTFTYAADTTAPTVSVKSATPTSVVLTFSKPVTGASVADANVLYRHTFNSSIYENAGNVADADPVTIGNQAFVTVNSSTQITLNFTNKPIPLGANKLYIAYANDNNTKITDLWGNKLAPAALDLNITLDTTKPTVKSVSFIDSATLKVVFSEQVDPTSATTQANYVVKDSTGAVKAQNANPSIDGTDTTGATYFLNFAPNTLGGGSYTIAISNVKDIALVKNVMDAYSTTISATDTVKPTVLNGKTLSDASDAAHQKITIYVPFSETMDPATLVKGNFQKDINGAGWAPLGANDTLTVAADGKSVTIVIDNAAVAIVSADILVGTVKDPAGNGLLTFTASSVGGADFTLAADSIAVEKVEAISKTQVKVYFDGRLSTVSATGYSFAVQDAAAGAAFPEAISVISHTVNATTNKSEVVFALGTALAESAKSGANNIQLVVNGATGTKSFLGTQVSNLAKNAAGATAGNLVDKIVPTVASVTATAATTIDVVFNENIESTTLAATLNGFSVSGGDAKLTSVVIVGGVDGTTIRLTGTGFAANTTVVTYNSVAGITDVGGNKVADFTQTAQ